MQIYVKAASHENVSLSALLFETSVDTLQNGKCCEVHRIYAKHTRHECIQWLPQSYKKVLLKTFKVSGSIYACSTKHLHSNKEFDFFSC